MQPPKFMKHLKNHQVFPFAEGLLKNRNMIPCDEQGRPIPAEERYEDPYTPRTELKAAVAQANQALTIAGTADSLNDLDRAGLIEFAVASDIKYDNKWNEQRLRTEIRAALDRAAAKR